MSNSDLDKEVILILAKSCNLLFDSLLNRKGMDIDEVIRLNTFLKCLIKGIENEV